MIEIDELNDEQLALLEQKIAAKKQAETAAKKAERDNYKSLVTQTVREQIVELQQVSNLLSLAKANVYGSFASLISLKNELYGSKSGQQSHTFSDDDGSSVTIGFRVIDKFDDTLDVGITMIREYINDLAVDENSANLVDMVNNLLKKDAKGNLKPNRVLDLQNLADKIQNDKFYAGVEIIRASYKPVRSAIFVEAEVLDATGKKQSVALSITSVDFPVDFEPNFEVFKP
ncbi:MAG: hypothetical protein A2W90_18140 [Bacteroidetes bacterium GWF2_42_66]|nr:MAG: hypothetical protein A2W92_06130 [Bacteroidetes bacterium GWA2_42_15]OFX98173.1 MAG: hypothetical protein A2W89_09630 [Bacteroidetes bacterium GWE2_42_39]OFY42558.1 MAG: hypothetical protein A2W90_18140 [Bacteroidetes bacterium GWF2_42_66]HBL74274.1 hypothetical protein [Prolixibacteraceae bacterium]HCU64043.1 hypothetical protein [Prolixibacteraceae bacterium]